GWAGQPIQPIKIIGINKLGTLLSSQTTGTSGLLGKPFPQGEHLFSFRTAVCFTSIFHHLILRNSAYLPEELETIR
ncbi:hypothetical protein ACFVRV_07225, partial [Arthrobacter koreensis]|uniref:hypothetical protein n=1 Tax=Arthrobacter koreensis TaxID=199136 RepID=UPI0036DCE1EC